MRGTRTYQIVIFIVILMGLSVLRLSDIGFSFSDFIGTFKNGTEFIEALVELYVAFLAADKVLNPHPMLHEGK